MTSNAQTSAARAVHALRNGIVEQQTHMREIDRSECVEMQENATVCTADSSDFESLLKPLTARQLTAINMLTMGKSVVATAASIKVVPSTIHRWKAGNPLFIAELNRRQVDLFDALVAKLRLTMGKAVDELFAMMNSQLKSERREVMWKMLSFIRPQKLLTPSVPTEPAEVIDEKIRAQRAARGEVVDGPIENQERLSHVDAEFVNPLARENEPAQVQIVSENPRPRTGGCDRRSLCTRGQGEGESAGRCVADEPQGNEIRNGDQTNENQSAISSTHPLTLTLSPEYGGEGTRDDAASHRATSSTSPASPAEPEDDREVPA